MRVWLPTERSKRTLTSCQQCGHVNRYSSSISSLFYPAYLTERIGPLRHCEHLTRYAGDSSKDITSTVIAREPKRPWQSRWADFLGRQDSRQGGAVEKVLSQSLRRFSQSHFHTLPVPKFPFGNGLARETLFRSAPRCACFGSKPRELWKQSFQPRRVPKWKFGNEKS